MLSGYRTYIVAGLIVIFGALSTLDWNVVLNDPKTGVSLIVTAIVMAILRTFTSTPPGVSKSKSKE